MTERVSDDVSVEILDRSAGRNRRLYVHVTEQPLEAGVSIGFIGQRIIECETIVAKLAALRAMNGDAQKIGVRPLPCRRIFRGEFISHIRVNGAARAKECGDIVGQTLKLYISDPASTDITAGPGERNPGCGRGLAAFIDHLRLTVAAQRRPIQERAAEADAAVRLEETVGVRNGDSHAIAVQA